jgi:hypothetical protein
LGDAEKGWTVVMIPLLTTPVLPTLPLLPLALLPPPNGLEWLPPQADTARKAKPHIAAMTVARIFPRHDRTNASVE